MTTIEAPRRSPEPEQQPEKPKKKKGLLIGLGTAAAALATGTAIFLGMKGGGDTEPKNQGPDNTPGTSAPEVPGTTTSPEAPVAPESLQTAPYTLNGEALTHDQVLERLAAHTSGGDTNEAYEQDAKNYFNTTVGGVLAGFNTDAKAFNVPAGAEGEQVLSGRADFTRTTADEALFAGSGSFALKDLLQGYVNSNFDSSCKQHKYDQEAGTQGDSETFNTTLTIGDDLDINGVGVNPETQLKSFHGHVTATFESGPTHGVHADTVTGNLIFDMAIDKEGKLKLVGGEFTPEGGAASGSSAESTSTDSGEYNGE